MSTTTEDKTYNGWPNYATWGVALVLTNDQDTAEHCERLATEAARAEDPLNLIADGLTTAERFTAHGFADKLKDYTEELCGLESDSDTLSLMARQVIAAGLAEVDWDEIARNLITGYAEISAFERGEQS